MFLLEKYFFGKYILSFILFNDPWACTVCSVWASFFVLMQKKKGGKKHLPKNIIPGNIISFDSKAKAVTGKDKNAPIAG